MISCVKMDGECTRKARFVANWNTALELVRWNTYKNAETKGLVKIVFQCMALNDLPVLWI